MRPTRPDRVIASAGLLTRGSPLGRAFPSQGATVAFPGFARRSQLRGQSRIRPHKAPHRVPYYPKRRAVPDRSFFGLGGNDARVKPFPVPAGAGPGHADREAGQDDPAGPPEPYGPAPLVSPAHLPYVAPGEAGRSGAFRERAMSDVPVPMVGVVYGGPSGVRRGLFTCASRGHGRGSQRSGQGSQDGRFAGPLDRDRFQEAA